MNRHIAQDAAAAAVASPQPASPATSKARLLIVDDQPAQRRAMCDTLSDHGFETVGCADAAQALAQLQGAPFDLLLTDLMMPGVDGIGLLDAALKIDPWLAGIVMTGEGTITSAVDAMRHGAFDYVLKPFKLSAMLPVIERALAVRRLRLDNAALEQRVRLHAAELEASNRELDAFAHSVSHDLRSPLAAVLGLTQLLRQDASRSLSDHHVKWLADIEYTTRRLMRVIDDLMRLSRLGRQSLQIGRVELAPLVREVVEELQQQVQHDVQVVYGELPAVMGDASLLRHVFVNLLSNAFKYTGRTECARIDIGCSVRDGKSICCVRDNGAGFDMAQTEKLFEVFHRMHPSSEFEGSGVGLSIVQRIVQRHGGRVWAEAARGHGAQFFFTLDPA